MRGCGFLLIILCLAVCPGCGGDANGPQATPLADVAGTVDLDGKPMDEPEGEVTFTVAGQPAVALPIKGGKFEGKAPVGEVHVEVSAFRLGKPIIMDGKPFGDPIKENYIADQFSGPQSTLKATIPTGGVKDLKFSVQSKK
jgi:hypothetical protein